MTMPQGRTRLALYYGLPMLFCALVHWFGWRMWFITDDFAWLGLRFEIHSPTDLFLVLFRPQAEGTVRTISERLFFLVLSSIFGLQSPPFRIWVFLTQFVNILLLIRIARRLTGSELAGFLAPILWCANAGLALAIGWSAAYNQIACSFFILLAFYLLLRYIETGERKYWIWLWVVFLLGFLALELNVVYPALAAGYALYCARTYFRKTLYLFIPSILFIAIHLFLISAPTDPYYKPVLGSSLFVMLWTYWSYALGALRSEVEDWRPLWLGVALTVAISAALFLFTVRMARRKQWLPLFLLGWFVVGILPVLPLKNHFTEYYVTVPAIGLAILGAWAIAQSPTRVVAAAAIVLAGLYLRVSITDIRTTGKYFYEKSRKMKYLVRGLQALPKSVTEKPILLRDVDNDMFWSGFYDDPFRLIGIAHLYLTPGTEQKIDAHMEWGGIAKFTIGFDDAFGLLRRHEASVYALQGRNLRDVTMPYLTSMAATAAARHPDFVDVVDPAYDTLLGTSWYPAENGFRWMPKSATLKMAGPKSAGQKLEVTGYCPELFLKKGPLPISFQADGISVGVITIRKPEGFSFELPLPAALVGRREMELQIEVSRNTEVPGDPRVLGVVFNTFRIK